MLLPKNKEPENVARSERAIVVATREHTIAFADGAASRWLRQYFPRPPRRRALPAKLARWLDGRGRVGSEKSLVMRQPGSRLIVSRQRRISQESVVLVLAVFADAPSEGRRHGPLTGCEAEVVFWAGESKSNGEIAKILDRKAGTVRKHLERAYEKLGVENRMAAAAEARRGGGDDDGQPGARKGAASVRR